MSLNQQYTWLDFLKAHPEYKEKGIKRTSSEAKKAFESAFKAHAKEHLEGLQKRCDRDIAKAKERRDAAMKRVKDLAKAKKFPKARLAQEKAGRHDSAIARLEAQKKAAQEARKSL